MFFQIEKKGGGVYTLIAPPASIEEMTSYGLWLEQASLFVLVDAELLAEPNSSVVFWIRRRRLWFLRTLSFHHSQWVLMFPSVELFVVLLCKPL
jgi:hypothetical protein